MVPRFFRGAHTTGCVFFIQRGQTYSKGLAYRGWFGSRTTIAVVPTTPQIISFAVEARTQDEQEVTVAGDLQVTFNPDQAVDRFDFTVDRQGQYQGEWWKDLQATVIGCVLDPIRDKVQNLPLNVVIRYHEVINDEIVVKTSSDLSPLPPRGIVVGTCSITRIEPSDAEVNQAIGAGERQALLTQADKALHGRRMSAAENERRIKAYEVETSLTLEQGRSQLIEAQAKNKIQEATAEGEAVAVRLKPLLETDAGKLLGLALMEMAKSGKVGQLAIAPELFTAIQQAAQQPK